MGVRAVAASRRCERLAERNGRGGGGSALVKVVGAGSMGKGRRPAYEFSGFPSRGALQRRASVPPFGQLLREYRERKRKTQKQLAIETRMSPSAIGKLERGERFAPYNYSLRKIARALDLSPEEQKRLNAAAIQAGPARPSSPRIGARDLQQRDELDTASDPDEMGDREADELRRRANRAGDSFRGMVYSN